jgi:hypothetical protein
MVSFKLLEQFGIILLLYSVAYNDQCFDNDDDEPELHFVDNYDSVYAAQYDE